MDIVTAGRHRGFSTIYFNHNLFRKSKLERDVELQNTLNLLFNTPRDVQQVAKLSVQLGFGSALVYWYRDARSISFGLLLIDLSPRTGDRSRYCTNSGNISSEFYVSNNLKQLKSLDDEHTKSLYSPSNLNFFPQMQTSISQSLSERTYPISQRVHRQPAARKNVRSKKKSHPKVQRRIHEPSTKRTTWKQRRSLLASKKWKKIIAQKNNFPFVINHLS